jgi:hypothetical protein
MTQPRSVTKQLPIRSVVAADRAFPAAVAELDVMREAPRHTINFQPREGVLELLGVTKADFDNAVFQSFIHTRRDCRASIHNLSVVFNGRQYHLTELAQIQEYGPRTTTPTPEDPAFRCTGPGAAGSVCFNATLAGGCGLSTRG